AGTGKHSRGNLACGTDITCAAGQMDSRKYPWNAGSSAATRRAALEGARRRGEAPDDARADGRAPRESSLRKLPQRDGSDRLRAIVSDAARNNYRFSDIIMGIVRSTPFQMRKFLATD